MFAGLPDGEPAESVHGVYRDLIASEPGRVRGWPVQARFLDVGSPKDYLKTVFDLAGTPDDAGVFEGVSEVDASARVTRSVVWAGARIGPDVALDRCVVAGGTQLPRGFRAAERVLVPASLLRASDGVEARDGVAVFPLSS